MASKKDLPVEAYEFYMFHPVEFCEDMIFKLTREEREADKFGARLEPETKKMLNAVAQNDYASIHSGRGVTKCVDEDDPILLADGRYVKAKELVGKKFKVLSLGPDCKVITDAYALDNGVQECIRLETNYGAEATRTTNHPFLKFDGWTPISKIQVGDKLAMPNWVMPLVNKKRLYEAEIKFLAYMIGDGSMSGNFSFSQENNAVLAEMREVVDAYDCKLVYVGGYDYRIVRKNKGPNLGRKLFRSYGLLGCNSHEKFVPEEIFLEGNDGVALFLNRLMATDGTIHVGVGKRVGMTICLTTVSHRLAIDVKRLFLRFGIVSKVHRINTTWTYDGIKKRSHAWQCSIHDAVAIERFCLQIGTIGKEDKVSACLVEARRRLDVQEQMTTGARVWPDETLSYLLEMRDRLGLRDKDFRKYSIRKREKRYGKTVTERTLNRLMREYPDDKICNLLDNGVQWDTVTSVERVGRRRTVAITVPEYENYACDLWEHNTTSVALLAIWWIFTRNNSRVIATGPKFDQLKITLWAEILKWLQKSAIKDKIGWTSERLYHKWHPGTAFGQIITSKEKENISGIHSDHTLYIVDEASNVEEDIIEAILGGMNDPECKIVLTGNPTKASGAFFNSFTKDAQDWKVLHFNSEECKRVPKMWLKRMQRWPRESDMYRVNVLGLPPKGNPQAVISLSECMAARDRTVEAKGELEVGVDPAWEGNDLTTLAIRRGMKLLEVETHAKSTSQEEYRHVLTLVRKWRKKEGCNGRVRVKIDAGGGYGKGLIEFVTLNEKDNLEAVPVHFNATGNDEYKDYGTIMWFNMAELIMEAEIPRDEELIEELSTREWRPVDMSRIKLETKADYKKRIGRSPDRADAVVLCFAGGARKLFSVATPDATTKDFQVDWKHEYTQSPEHIHMLDVLHYGGLHLSKNMALYFLAGIYEKYQDILWLYAEHIQESPVPDMMIPVIKYKTKYGLYSDERNVKIFGNQRMFKASEDKVPMAQIFRRGKLFLRAPEKMDEYGAIGLGAQMYRQKKIVLHKDLVKARMQVSLWSLEKGAPEEEGAELCQCLLLILSELRKHRKPLVPQSTFPDYKPVRMKHEDKTRKELAWMKR